jgi:hypothetical protein
MSTSEPCAAHDAAQWIASHRKIVEQNQMSLFYGMLTLMHGNKK